MHKITLFSTLAAVSLFSGSASAVTLTNHDKADVSVVVAIDGKTETVLLKENASFDSKGKDASFTLGTEKPVAGKASEQFVIKGGKIEMQATKAEITPEPAKVEPVKPEAKLEKPVADTKL